MDRRPGFLIVTWGPNKGTIIPLGAGQRVWIGRRNEAFEQTDSRMSRIHFRLKPHGESWVVEDQRSSNGTFLNGKAIHGSQALSDGDLIQAGRTLIAFFRITPALLAAAAPDLTDESGAMTGAEGAAAKGKGEFWPRMFRRRRAAAPANPDNAPQQASDPSDVSDVSDESDESPTQIIEGQMQAPNETPSDSPTDLEDAAPADAWAQALRSEIIQRDQEPDLEADEPFDESDESATTDQNGSSKKRDKTSSSGSSGSSSSTPSRPRSRKGRPLETEDDFNSTILGTDEQLSMVLKDDED